MEPKISIPRIFNSTPKNNVEKKPFKDTVVSQKPPKKPVRIANGSPIKPKVANMTAKPTQMQVAPIAIMPKVVTKPQANELIDGETWATIVSKTPMCKVSALRDTPPLGKGDSSAIGIDEDSPGNTTVLMNGIVCRVPSPLLQAAQGSKNVMTPRVLRPRAS